MNLILAVSILLFMVLMVHVAYRLGAATSEKLQNKVLPQYPSKSVIPSIVMKNTIYPMVRCGGRR